jgi:hypothetical protein
MRLAAATKQAAAADWVPDYLDGCHGQRPSRQARSLPVGPRAAGTHGQPPLIPHSRLPMAPTWSTLPKTCVMTSSEEMGHPTCVNWSDTPATRLVLGLVDSSASGFAGYPIDVIPARASQRRASLVDSGCWHGHRRNCPYNTGSVAPPARRAGPGITHRHVSGGNS